MRYLWQLQKGGQATVCSMALAEGRTHTLSPSSPDGQSWQNKGHYAVWRLLPTVKGQPLLSPIACLQAPGKAGESS